MGFRFSTAFVAALALLAALLAPGAIAKTFKPNTRADHAPNGCNRQDCTLREAVIASNERAGKDKIVLRKGKPYKLKQEGNGEEAAATGDLDVTDELSVKGKPKAKVDGGKLESVFSTPTTALTANLKLSKLTVTRAISSAVAVNGGTAKVSKSKLAGNDAESGNGGGLSVSLGATATISKSTVSDNRAANGGAGVYANGDVTIVASTISGNKATATGGGLKVQGGTATIRNSTFSGNRTTADGGGISAASGTVTLNNVTIANNEADSNGDGGTDVGGGISAGGMINVSNTIIADNRLGGDPMPLVDVNCDGTFASGGGNLRGSDDTGCAGFTGSGDIVEPNPKLGKLARNGGPTKTIALQKGSPAINAADDASAEPKDQRGVTRNNPDIGAYER